MKQQNYTFTHYQKYYFFHLKFVNVHLSCPSFFFIIFSNQFSLINAKVMSHTFLSFFSYFFNCFFFFFFFHYDQGCSALLFFVVALFFKMFFISSPRLSCITFFLFLKTSIFIVIEVVTLSFLSFYLINFNCSFLNSFLLPTLSTINFFFFSSISSELQFVNFNFFFAF